MQTITVIEPTTNAVIPKLSPGQEKVLNYIQSMLHKGVAPSLPQIADRFGFKAHSSAQDHVNALIKKGFLRRIVKGHREALELVNNNLIATWDDKTGEMKVMDGKLKVRVIQVQNGVEKFVGYSWITKKELLIEWERIRAQVFENYVHVNERLGIWWQGLGVFGEAMSRMSMWLIMAVALKDQFTTEEWRRIKEIDSYVSKYYEKVKELNKKAMPRFFAKKLWEFSIVRVDETKKLCPFLFSSPEVPRFARKASNALVDAISKIEEGKYEQISRTEEEKRNRQYEVIKNRKIDELTKKKKKVSIYFEDFRL